MVGLLNISRTYEAQQSVAKCITKNVINLVTHKVTAEHELLFHKTCFPPALDVTKFTNIRDMNLDTLCCATLVGLMFKQTRLCFLRCS
jgi:hypothetical protein